MNQLSATELNEVQGGGISLAAAALSGAINGGLAGYGTSGTALGTATGAACGAAVGMATGGNTTASSAAGAICGFAQASPSGNGIGSADASCSVSCSASNADACTGGGGGGGGKVICTELCRNGVIEHDVWMADIRYSRNNFSEQTMRGYHLWGIPYVRLMRRSPIFARLAAHPTRWFAEDIAYRMGVRSTPNLKGWALREVFFRPVCSAIGLFAKARDWTVLWNDDKRAA